MTISAAPLQQEKATKKDWWNQVTSGELFEASLRLSPEKIQQGLDATRDLGKSLGGAWKDLRDNVRKVFDLPMVDEVVSSQDREKISEITVAVAASLGYAAAGIQGLAGLAKIRKARGENHQMKKLEGYLDLATAGAIASHIAGMAILPVVLGPIAAGLGMARGGIHAVAGWKAGDTRREVQGLLDATRSTAILGTIVGSRVPWMATTAAVFAPVAGVIQASRGFIDLRDGVRGGEPARRFQGLADIGSAVGLTMAATGAGAIPGAVLTGLCVGARLLYSLSDRFEAWADRKLDRVQPQLETAVGAVEKVWNPILYGLRGLLEKATGWQHPDTPGGAKDSVPPS